MEIVISVSEAELEEFPEEAPESSRQQEQSGDTSHTGTVESLLSINTSPTPELLEKIKREQNSLFVRGYSSRRIRL